MGYDVYGLLADWPATVQAARASGGTDFFWEHEDIPPCFVERDFAGGWAFQSAAFTYNRMRPFLPGPLLERTDAVIGMFYTEDVEEDDFADVDDLAADAGLSSSGAFYALRPRRVAVMAEIGVPWAEVAAAIPPEAPCYLDDRVRDFDGFRWVIDQQLAWLREAAAGGRGVVAMVGF